MDSLLDRRQLLRFGSLALTSLALPAAPGRRSRPRADACILLYLDGGPSHIDTFDPKPDAHAEIRGPFKSIATTLPGVRLCEHLPRLATRMHRLVQLRGVRHTETVHDPAVYQMLTGRKHPSSAGGLTVQPTDFPHLACALGKVDRKRVVLPRIIEVPETMKMEARVLPGQNGGFLGPRYDPFRVEVTPTGCVVPPPFAPRPETPVSRLRQRASLLEKANQRLAWLDRQEATGKLDAHQRRALELLSRPDIRQAFDLNREPAAIRERYGLHRHGQSVLLARRLVEAGTRFVTVYWGKEKQDWADGKGARLANNPWDTHRNHFPLCKDSLLPRADQTLAALIDDLSQRGLFERVLVVWMGDFGRTPRITKPWASRDHWPGANTILMAGAGLPQGLVRGKTDRHAATVTEGAVSPADVTATVLTLLGVNPRSEIHDGQGRPFALSEGDAIRELVG